MQHKQIFSRRGPIIFLSGNLVAVLITIRCNRDTKYRHLVLRDFVENPHVRFVDIYKQGTMQISNGIHVSRVTNRIQVSRKNWTNCWFSCDGDPDLAHLAAFYRRS